MATKRLPRSTAGPAPPLRHHPDWPDYAVDARGRVWSYQKPVPRLMKPRARGTRKPQLQVTREGERAEVLVSRFLAGCVDGPPPPAWQAPPALDRGARVVGAYRAILGLGRRPGDSAAATVLGLAPGQVREARKKLASLGLWPLDLRGWPRASRGRCIPVAAPAPPAYSPTALEIAEGTALARARHLKAMRESCGPTPGDYLPRVGRVVPRGGIRRHAKSGH